METLPATNRWVRIACGRPHWWAGRRLAATLVSITLLILAIAALVVQEVAFGAAPLLAITAFAPYIEFGAAASLAIFAAGRMLAGVLLATACLIGLVVTHAGLFVADTAPSGPRLTVLTANLKVGGADARDLVASVRSHHVDVLMVQELTGPELDALSAAGLGAMLPYSVSEARPLYAGTGMWSRYPLSGISRRSDFVNAFVTASIRPSAAMPAVQLAALHLPGPFPVSADWTRDVERLRHLLAGWSRAAPVIIGGDFNATLDTARFHTLLADGFRDAADQAGAGLTATYPADLWLPPLIAIDHVLTRDAVATRIDTLTIPGSDHRALLVRIGVAG
ncbi:MAG: endonuclease/exonuclease/phosphatase family protein [Pseudonocardiales bacterium]|nr:MAG: endonuclease/exonuclease/phosphatase family protein [Pseudonocardiales bacterium]